jgi:hypothetical protein
LKKEKKIDFNFGLLPQFNLVGLNICLYFWSYSPSF